MTSDRERWAWGAIAVAGGALVAACVVPVFEVAIEAQTSSGAEYRYEEVVTIVWDAGLLGAALPVAGMLVAAAALVALFWRRARPWLAVGALLAAIGLFVAQGFGTGGITRWSDDADVYPAQDGGPLIAAAVAQLKARAEASPEAQDPTWRIEGGDASYGLRRRGGGKLLLWSTVGLFWIAAYRVARLWLNRWLAVLTVAAVTIAAVVLSFLELLAGLED